MSECWKVPLVLLKEHRTKWYVGYNLFSSWRDQTEDEQRALYDEVGMGDFERVESVQCEFDR